MIKNLIHLTEGQKKFLENLPLHKNVLVKPWNHKGIDIASKIIDEIKGIAPNLEIMLFGSIPLKIAGQDDIDISVFCVKSQQAKHLSNFRKLFGEPIRMGKSSIAWEFQKDRFNVSVWLTDPNAETTKAQVKIFTLLKENPKLLREYENIKVKAKNLSYREYQRKKYQFYNKILQDKKCNLST